MNPSPHPHHQETPPLTLLCWHLPTQTLDDLAMTAAHHHYQEFPYFSPPSSPFMTLAPTQVMNPKKGKEPEQLPLENNQKGGTPETHFGIRELMTKTLVTLSYLQLEFHLTMEWPQEQEVLLNQDWSLEVDLTNQAMDHLL